jgi:hypothetical protein
LIFELVSKKVFCEIHMSRENFFNLRFGFLTRALRALWCKGSGELQIKEDLLQSTKFRFDLIRRRPSNLYFYLSETMLIDASLVGLCELRTTT